MPKPKGSQTKTDARLATKQPKEKKAKAKSKSKAKDAETEAKAETKVEAKVETKAKAKAKAQSKPETEKKSRKRKAVAAATEEEDPEATSEEGKSETGRKKARRTTKKNIAKVRFAARHKGRFGTAKGARDLVVFMDSRFNKEEIEADPDRSSRWTKEAPASIQLIVEKIFCDAVREVAPPMMNKSQTVTVEIIRAVDAWIRKHHGESVTDQDMAMLLSDKPEKPFVQRKEFFNPATREFAPLED